MRSIGNSILTVDQSLAILAALLLLGGVMVVTTVVLNRFARDE